MPKAVESWPQRIVGFGLLVEEEPRQVQFVEYVKMKAQLYDFFSRDFDEQMYQRLVESLDLQSLPSCELKEQDSDLVR